METDYSDRFESALESSKHAHLLDRIETRACSSDNYDGVEYAFYGDYIPVMPIIEEAAHIPGHGIEEISFIEEDDPRLLVFLADAPDSSGIESAFV